MQDLVAQIDAVHTSAAVYPLTERAFLRITGVDATRWLNGMVTNSIRDLAPLEGNYNFLLNAQGRIEGDCTIYRAGTGLSGTGLPGSGLSEAEAEPEFVLCTSETQIGPIEALLDRFIIMDDVEITRVLYVDGIIPVQRGLGLLGKGAAHLLLRTLRLLNQSFTELPTPGHMLPDRANGTPFVVFTPPPTVPSAPCFEVWSQSGLQLDLIRENLLSMGAAQITPQAVEALRILHGQPRYGVDIRNTEHARDLPQETAQTHALHFNKGCYLGQEIVERIRSRGQVHRALTRFTLQGTMPMLPALLEASIAGQTRAAGELTSAVEIGGTLHALGYLRRELAAQPITYAGGTATPVTAVPKTDESSTKESA
jgi:folate-binding protein YgfZ